MDTETNKQTKGFHPDVPKAVREHLMGEHHTFRHRFITGTVISSLGLFIVWISHLSPSILEWPLHHIGYGVHGMGWLPIFSIFEKKGGKDGDS